MPSSAAKPLLVDLALQGGGAHGAFTWGVIDRLLDEPGLQLEGISGTSAGAMNAAVMVSGFEHGGVDGAKAALESFWKANADAGRFSPLQRGPLALLSGKWTLENSPVYMGFEMMSRMFSPYDLNPLNAHPLRSILAETVDFDCLAKARLQLFITATNVRTGTGRIFRNAEITPDVLIASACLPTMFQAVEIDGEAYWDGGYVGNPTITPLVRETDSHDTILVQINPIVRDAVPKSARDILNRLNEVAFNAPLVKELRMIALLHKLANKVPDVGDGESARWAAMRIHRIASDRVDEVDSSSKLITEWPFLLKLRDEGRRCAENFLAEHGASLGKRSTLDLDAMLATC
ncbi:MAG TPA: patatin-like phospholipase family protein [Rubrivivax sp.]|nr:patatin-like phospholipase family protein [Rubrivivax sp.]